MNPSKCFITGLNTSSVVDVCVFNFQPLTFVTDTQLHFDIVLWIVFKSISVPFSASLWAIAGKQWQTTLRQLSILWEDWGLIQSTCSWSEQSTLKVSVTQVLCRIQYARKVISVTVKNNVFGMVHQLKTMETAWAKSMCAH